MFMLTSPAFYWFARNNPNIVIPEVTLRQFVRVHHRQPAHDGMDADAGISLRLTAPSLKKLLSLQFLPVFFGMAGGPVLARRSGGTSATCPEGTLGAAYFR